MKKLLSILSVLCLTVSGFAQTLTPVQFYIREAGKTTNLYQVTAVRNESTYPYTSKGNSDFLAAVSSGAIQRVTGDDCIIPVGQKAPIQKPTCGTNSTTAPSWITGLRYRYESPQKLRFEAKGSISQAKFARVDGQSFSIPNPDNINIENDKYYGYGEISGDANGYDKQWQINIPAVALKVTFQKSGSSDTYTAQLTPNLSVGTVQLITTTTTNPGTTTATTTAGYGGIFAANNTYVEMPEQGRSGSGEQNGQYNRVYLTPSGDGVKVGVNLRVAGVLDYVSATGAYGGKNMANSPIWGNGNLDMGRQWQYGHYGWPNGAGDEFTDPGSGQKTHGIGFQPLEGGDEGDRGEEADLKVFHKSSSLIYTKVQPLHWDLSKVKAQMYMEKWIRHDPNDPYAFRMHGRWTMFRTDAKSNEFPGGLRTQETPCFMMNVDFTDIRFATGKPYQGNWQTVQQAVGDGTQVRSTEPCLAAIDSRTGKGWAFYSPISGRWGHNRDIRREGFDWQTSNEKDFVVFYVASTPFLVADKNGVYDMDMAAKYGTVDELKAWCYAQPRWTGRFNYVFNQKSRLNWYYNHAGDQLEKNITDYIEVVPILYGDQLGKDMKFSSPETWVNGEVVKKIYIDADFVNGASQMKIVWSNPASPGTERKKVFSITPNAGRKTYTVDMTGVDGWDNVHPLGFSIQYNDPNSDGQYPNIDSVKWRIYKIYSDK